MNVLSELQRRCRLLRFRIEQSRQPLLSVADKAAIHAARLSATRPRLAAHAWRLATERRLYHGCRALPGLTLEQRQAAGRAIRAARAAQLRVLERAQA